MKKDRILEQLIETDDLVLVKKRFNFGYIIAQLPIFSLMFHPHLPSPNYELST